MTTPTGTEDYSLYSPDFSIEDARFLASTDLVVAKTSYKPSSDATGSLLILRAGKQAFDPAVLLGADAARLREFQSLKASAGGTVSRIDYDRFATELAAAGADDALHLANDDIRRAKLVPALNNLGF